MKKKHGFLPLFTPEAAGNLSLLILNLLLFPFLL